MDRREKTIIIKCKRTDRKQIQKVNKSEKLEKLVDYLDTVKQEEFSGYIKINFSQGSIGRIEKCEKLLE